MSQRSQSTFEMSTAPSNSADPAHIMHQGKIGGSEEPFAALVKPFDSVHTGAQSFFLHHDIGLLILYGVKPTPSTPIMTSLISAATHPTFPLSTRRTSSSSEISRPLALTTQFADDGTLPATRAYPDVLDITSPTGDNHFENAASDGMKEQDNDRPWPKPNKHQNASKRKQETNQPGRPELPAHQQGRTQLQRWLQEPPIDGPYHGIAYVAEACPPAHPAGGNDTKKHRG